MPIWVGAEVVAEAGGGWIRVEEDPTIGLLVAGGIGAAVVGAGVVLL